MGRHCFQVGFGANYQGEIAAAVKPGAGFPLRTRLTSCGRAGSVASTIAPREIT